MKSFLLAQLQEAIDDAVAESGRIAEIVGAMKSLGYDVSLMLESTVAISPTEDNQPGSVPEPRLATDGEIDLTLEDLEFLQELNIAA